VNAEMNLLIILKSGIYSLTERLGGGIAICYGLYGTEFEPWWREEILSFAYSSRLGLGQAQPSLQLIPFTGTWR